MEKRVEGETKEVHLPKSGNRSKKRKNTGKAYVSTSGKLIQRKTFNKDFKCTCKHTECNQVTCEERNHSFDAFGKLGDTDLQNAFILQNTVS